MPSHQLTVLRFWQSSWKKPCRAPRGAQRQPRPRPGRAPPAPSGRNAAKRAPPGRTGAATLRGAEPPTLGPPSLPAGQSPEPAGPGRLGRSRVPIGWRGTAQTKPRCSAARHPWASVPLPPPAALTPASPAYYRGACTFLGPPTAPGPARSVLYSSHGRLGSCARQLDRRPDRGSSILPQGAAGREGALTTSATTEPPGRHGGGGVPGRTGARWRGARCP